MWWTELFSERSASRQYAYADVCSLLSRWQPIPYLDQFPRWPIYFFLWCIFFQYQGTNFFYDLQMPATSAMMYLNILHIFFYMSQKYNTNSMELSNAIYQTEWYQYPRSVQLFVLHMMMRSQQPFFLSAYGIMSLNLESFVGVSIILFDGSTARWSWTCLIPGAEDEII